MKNLKSRWAARVLSMEEMVVSPMADREVAFKDKTQHLVAVGLAQSSQIMPEPMKFLLLPEVPAAPPILQSEVPQE